jgi:hypothetical protein
LSRKGRHLLLAKVDFNEIGFGMRIPVDRKFQMLPGAYHVVNGEKTERDGRCPIIVPREKSGDEETHAQVRGRNGRGWSFHQSESIYVKYKYPVGSGQGEKYCLSVASIVKVIHVFLYFSFFAERFR